MNERLPQDDRSQRIDLHALDPDALPGGADRFTEMVLAKLRESATPPEIPLDPLYGLWSLPRQMLIAASILLLAALVLPRHAPTPASAPATVAEAVGALPSPFLTGDTRR
jgi:hypothetical protein